MEWAIAILAFAVLGATVVVAAGGFGEMAAEPARDSYRQDLPDAWLSPDDIQRLRFGVGIRGYETRQVDDALARLSHEIADRDDEIARLRGQRQAAAPTGRH